MTSNIIKRDEPNFKEVYCCDNNNHACWAELERDKKWKICNTRILNQNEKCCICGKEAIRIIKLVDRF